MDDPLALPYYQLHEFKVKLCGQEIRVISKPGLPEWNDISPVVQLLAEEISPVKDSRVLILGCDHGVFGVVLLKQGRLSTLEIMDTSQVALRVSRETMAVNGLPGESVKPLQYPLLAETFHTVIIHLPKGRKLARRWLLEAWNALLPDGDLYLAGANQEGIQSVIKDAGSLFGNATVLAYRKGCRVARMVKQKKPGDASISPAWIAELGIALNSWSQFSARVCGENFSIFSLPGVFSFDRVDQGTELLLQQLSRQQVQGRRVLDFGCGYGLIGMAAARLGAEWVDMLDVDLSAVASAQGNCTRNLISNSRVLPSDVLDAISTERFDLVLSNPPFHTGKQVEYSMAETFILHSHFILKQGGSLILVANRFIRYDRLMKEVYGNVRTLAETGKYHVLESMR